MNKVKIYFCLFLFIISFLYVGELFNKVNIFDGHNGYEGSNSYLKQVSYFTDTNKNTPDDDRPEIFYLTPNSVTKVRVYIYIEGQDVDNYDIDAEGKKIKVTFGFTKDKFDTAGMVD